MRKVKLSKTAQEYILKMNKKEQARILKKIYYFSSLKDPRSTAKPMQERLIGKRRRRIGAYRVIFDIDDAGRIIIVLIVGHRRDVYR